jgi:hypothetical protein
VGACGYVLSWLALNGAATLRLSSSGAFQVPENPWAWLLGAWACVELGYEEELQQGDTW